MQKSNIPWAKPYLFGHEKDYVSRAIDSSWISSGTFVDEFEDSLRNILKMPFGISTSNGTAALHLALLGYGIGEGDEVIVPGFAFAAAANMVLSVGAKPVFVDVDPHTWCIDPDCVKKNISQQTKAVVAVHTYGNVCDMAALQNITAKNNLLLIEDTAEALFSKYDGQYAGSLSDVGCFSFQATKTLPMGEGGFVCLSDESIYRKMLLIRNHGMSKEKKYWHEEIGFNFRLTNLHAAIGCAQLENMNKIIAMRKEAAGQYVSLLSSIKGISLQRFYPEIEAVPWGMAIKLNENASQEKRDVIIKSLLSEGIETRPGFYSFSDMPLYKAPILQASKDISDHTICLPFYAGISEEDISRVCESLNCMLK